MFLLICSAMRTMCKGTKKSYPRMLLFRKNGIGQIKVAKCGFQQFCRLDIIV